jgi:hypothetical protein
VVSDTSDTNVTVVGSAPESGQSGHADNVTTASPKPKTWAMPRSPITAEHADRMGRIALAVAAGIGRFIAGAARYCARVIGQIGRSVEAVPSNLKVFVVAGMLLLVGLVGAIAAEATLGLVSTVVVIPACSGILGILGYRWYNRLDGAVAQPDARTAEPTSASLQRSVEYVDNRLALALASLGTDHHRQAVIAIVQAKTAVELTLGTESDAANHADVPLRAGEDDLRPRIRIGSTSALRESSSLAAS